MADDVEARLAAAAEVLREYEATRQRWAHLRGWVDELARRLDSLRAQHASKHRRVERLERLSLAWIVASLRRARAEHLARERAEAAAAYYQVRVVEAYLKAVRRDHQTVQARLAELAEAPAAYAAILDEKERALAHSGDSRGERLRTLTDERRRLAGELHALTEALRAAGFAQGALAQVRHRLAGASRWAVPLSVVRDPISSHLAHTRLEQATAAAAYADRCLAALRTRLVEVGTTVPPDFQLWLDAGVLKLSIRDQVARAQQSVDRWATLVCDAHGRLERRSAESRAALRSIESQRRRLLTIR